MPRLPDAVILCGGAGLRLRSITENAPKAMARIAGRPFLELLLRQLRRHNFERVILAVGYREDLIRLHFGERAFDLSLAYAVESSPLGTGGALRNAVEMVETDTALILNGDSYTDVDLSRFVADHNHAKAEISIVVVPGDGRGDCGNVLVDPEGQVSGFSEKEKASEAHQVLNAGIYLMSRGTFSSIPPGVQISLEQELFPRWLAAGRKIRAFFHPGRCVDIGTPDRYRIAQQLLANTEQDHVPSPATESPEGRER